MDHTDTAKAVMRRHRRHCVWAFFRISRCRSCLTRWPCNPWHNARDVRDRVADRPAIERMTDIVRRRYGMQPPNRGPRS